MLRKLLVRVQSSLFWALWRLAEHRDVSGFEVGVSGSNARDEDLAFQKVHAAIRLIEVHEPHRLHRMHADVRRFHVFGSQAQYLGRWLGPLKMCQLAENWVLRANTLPADIACTIVHEATHARLARFGYQEGMRKRIELSCHRQEEVFAARLPNGAELVEQARRAQQRSPDFYSDANSRERSIAALRSLGVPNWFIRALKYVVRKRAA